MNNFLKALGYFIASLIFVLSAVFLSTWLTRGNKDLQATRSIVSCPPDRLSYTTISQNNDRVVSLIGQKKNMSASNKEFVNSQVVIAKSETATSKVACGYLFIRAGTETVGALQSWEDVYINPNAFGGHLLSKSAFSVNDGQSYSEYIYSLDKIQYWRSIQDHSILTADWASLLNVSPEVSFTIALNTNDHTGFIDEVSIAYKCWDPATGEENTGCRLSVKSSEDINTSQPLK